MAHGEYVIRKKELVLLRFDDGRYIKKGRLLYT